MEQKLSTHIFKSKQEAESKLAGGNTFTLKAHHPVTYFLQPDAPPNCPPKSAINWAPDVQMPETIGSISH